MTERRRVVVAGAGVLGLSVALTLQWRGLAVLLLDPDPGHSSASSVAAGLLAPFGEALFDPTAAPHHELLLAAKGLWAGFAARSEIALADDDLVIADRYAPAAQALGAKSRRHAGKIWIEGDGRVVDPPAALAAMRRAFNENGGRVEVREASDRDAQPSGFLILATGPGSSRLTTMAPELGHLTPVKGQIAVLPHGPTSGPTLRWPGGYVAPQTGGTRIGATMENGIADTRIEPEVIMALVERARVHSPELDITGAYGQAGVRMQAPDGLPMVGPSRAPGVCLATGARRNGWLLAPLVGEMIAAYVVGEDPGPWAAMLHPGRFD